MTIEEVEQILKEAADARVASVDDNKILDEVMRKIKVQKQAGKAAEKENRSASSPPPRAQTKTDCGNSRGGIAVLNPFSYGAKGIAIFAAAVLLLVGGISALTVWVVNRNVSPDSAYMIELLTDTEVNMEGVTAFGIVKSRDTVKASALYDNEKEDAAKERKFDTTLVSFDENGDISEVVFRYTDGSGEVTQDEIGFADKIYVTTEFTYIQYSTPDDIYRDQGLNNSIPIEIFFRCDDYCQSFAIHNESGKVYSLEMIGKKYVSDVVGDNNKFEYVHLTVFDGAINADIRFYKENHGSGASKTFKLNVDTDYNLIAEDLMPNESARIDNIYRDVYGNLYVYNYISYNLGLNETYGNVKYFSSLSSSNVSYFYGSDRKVYVMTRTDLGYTIEVFDENLQITELTELPDISLFDMSISYRQHTNSNNQTLLIKNGYLFQIGNGEYFITCFKHMGNGTFEMAKIDNDSDVGYLVKSYLLDGELMAVVDKNGKRQFVHIDLSEYDEIGRKVIVTDICDASYVTEPYGMLLKSIIIVNETFTGTQKYQITYENGRIKQTLLSDEKYGGQIISIQPLN